MSLNYQAQLNIMYKSIRKGAKVFIRDFGEIINLQGSRKSIADFVKISISRAEKIIAEELQFAKPEYSLTSNSFNLDNRSSVYRWVINPLDGVKNYSRAQPYFCMSLGLEKNDQLVACLIEAPIMGETYFGEKGGGAWLEKHSEILTNKNRLRVSAVDHLANSLIVTEELDQISAENYTKFIDKNIDVRITGCTELSLAFLAAGKFDCLVSQKVNKSYMANLLVMEAGGCMKINNELMIFCNNLLDKEVDKIFN